MKLFSFKARNKEEDKKHKQEQEQRRKQARSNSMKLASIFVMVLLLTSMAQAGYVAAWGLSSITHSISHTLHKVTHVVKDALAGAGAGAAVGAVVGSVVPGIGTAIGALGGAIIGGIIGGIMGYKSLSSSSSSSSGGAGVSYTSENATISDITDGKDLINETGAINNATRSAYKELAKLTQMLRSDLIKYDVSMNSSTGDFSAEIHGPSKIYGFSAFPVQVVLHVGKNPIPQAVVHLQKVVVQVVDHNGTVYYTRTWTFRRNQTALNGQNYILTTILKMPDQYIYSVQKAIQDREITQSLINKLENAKTIPFEIRLHVQAVREDWVIVNGKAEHKGDLNISLSAITTSAWRHVTGTNDMFAILSGWKGTLPPHFINAPAAGKWTMYDEKVWGALSDFLVKVYANPVHVMDSSAAYQFYIAANPGYFYPLTPRITDDFVIAPVRIQLGGSWELADWSEVHLGNITKFMDVQSVVKYTSGGNKTLNYRVFSLAVINIHRDDGQVIPIWFLVEPQIAVMSSQEEALKDTQLLKILTILNQSQLSKADIEEINSIVEAMSNALNEKIETSEQYLRMAKNNNNKQAIEYFESAIESYKNAQRYLHDVSTTKNKQWKLNYLNAAKKMEYAGDYYYQAGLNALYGDPDQAKILAQDGDQSAQLAKRYVPHLNVWGTAKSLLGHKVLGIPLWILLIIIFALAAAFVIWKKFL